MKAIGFMQMLSGVAAVSSIMLGGVPARAEVLEQTKKVAGVTVHYKVVLPDGYDATKTYPGIIAFGGGPQTMNTVDGILSRNFQAEATVPNPERRLVPGMFVRVAVLAGDVKRYLTLPQTSITYNPYGATVFLAQKKPGGTDKDLIAQQSFVTLGPTRGDQVAVLRGVKEGDLIVTSGQLKLNNGTPRIISNSVQPVNDPDPSPQEQ